MTQRGVERYKPPRILNAAAADMAVFWHFSAPDKTPAIPSDPYLELFVHAHRKLAEKRGRFGRGVLRSKIALDLLHKGRYAPDAYSYTSPPLKIATSWPQPEQPIVFTVPTTGEELHRVDGTYNTLHHFGYALQDYKELPGQLRGAARWLRENRAIIAPETIAVTHADMIETLQKHAPDLMEGVAVGEVCGYPYKQGVLDMANSARRVHGRDELPVTAPVYGFVIPTDELIERGLGG